MAEVSINSGITTHSINRAYASGDICYYNFAYYTCSLGHPNCMPLSVDATLCSTIVPWSVSHKKTGQISVLGQHTHVYQKASGSIYVFGLESGLDTCPAGHANCQSSSTGGSATLANNTVVNADTNKNPAGEVSINKRHAHTYDINSTVQVPHSLGISDCPVHSNCKSNVGKVYVAAAATYQATSGEALSA